MDKLKKKNILEFYTELYTPYINELKRHGGQKGMTFNTLRSLLEQDFMEVYIFDKGFILVEQVSGKLLYQPMKHIVEFYVVPECRRKGIGSKAFSDFLKTEDQPIFFNVLPKNEAAMRFWEKQISNNDLREIKPDPKQVKFSEGMILHCVCKDKKRKKEVL